MTDRRKALSARDLMKGPLNLIELPLPALGGVVYIKPPSAAAAIRFAEVLSGVETQDDVKPRMMEATFPIVAESVVDETGTPVFDGVAVDELSRMDVATFKTLQEAVLSILNRGRVDDKEGPVPNVSSEAENSASPTT